MPSATKLPSALRITKTYRYILYPCMLRLAFKIAKTKCVINDSRRKGRHKSDKLM